MQVSSDRYAVFVHDVSKSLGSHEVLKGVSFQLAEGSILALLGPNGAGKTTTISLLQGRRRPDRGIVRLFGHDPRHPSTRHLIGVTPQETDFPALLSVGEIVELVRRHYATPLQTSSALERFGLAQLRDRHTGGLSGGQKRRLAVALAFVGNPRLVFLDEPSAGLDTEIRRKIWQEIRTFTQEGGSVLLTTHYLDEAEALASQIALLDQGRIITQGSVAEIKAQMGLSKVSFVLANPLEFSDLPPVSQVQRLGDIYTCYSADADMLIRELVRRDIPFHHLEVMPLGLEEAFLLLTGGAM
jgi:ABC-2 type transport system ATP-binding protein